jgi:hypothetical protein
MLKSSALETLAGKGSSDEVRKQATGALWILSGWQESVKCKTTPAPPAPPPPPGVGAPPPPPPPTLQASAKHDQLLSDKKQEVQHVFISYNWGSKPMVFKIKEQLKNKGYKVWMDVENMSEYLSISTD